jgi:SRSO17 transposase
MSHQKLLNAASWSADELLAGLRGYVGEHPGDPGLSLVLDKTQVQKKETKSVAVAPQEVRLTTVDNDRVLGVSCPGAPPLRGKGADDRSDNIDPDNWLA